MPKARFAATGDSNLYLRRDADALTLTVEHRAAPSPKPFNIELASRGLALALEVAERREAETLAPASLDERIIVALSHRPLPFLALRAACRVRSATLQERISALTEAGRIIKTEGTWRIAD